MIEEITIIVSSDIGESITIEAEAEQVTEILVSAISKQLNKLFYEAGKKTETDLQQSQLFGILSNLRELEREITDR